MTTAAWWHCFAGIAGDMALGSLIDAGADLDEVAADAQRPARSTAGSSRPSPSCAAAWPPPTLIVHTAETGVVRTHAHIAGLLTEARLPERVRARALATFADLAEVEGRLHRRPPAQVHFHEVGGIDAIVDIVGTCAALELLGVDQVYASPVATGHRHDPHQPRGAAQPGPRRGRAAAGRAHLRPGHPGGADHADRARPCWPPSCVGWGPMPAMRIDATGFGAGTRELDGLPNAVAGRDRPGRGRGGPSHW